MDIHLVYDVFMSYFRRRRIQQFRKLFPIDNVRAVLDLGGTTYWWDRVGYDATVTLLNIEPSNRHDPRYRYVTADACNTGLSPDSYDLCFSNSVIEHVGDYERQKAFAEEMLRLGKMIYCQTPNRWFFVEPHLITLFLHWLPIQWQVRLIPYLSVWGWVTNPSRQRIENFVRNCRLMTKRELQELFPDCEVIAERFMLIPKSWIVVRGHVKQP